MQKSLNIAQMPHYCKTLVRRSVLFHDDCFNILSNIENESVDLILCDLPYGTTKNKWDSTVPLDKLWAEYERIITYNGAIVLFAQTPFDKVLGASKIDLLKYEYIWNKKRPTGHLNSKFAPMKQHENILVFSKASACFVKDKSKAMRFNPQYSKGKPYTIFRADNSSSCYDLKHQKKNIETVNDGFRYPTSILEFAPETGLHPTQKPLSLLEYLVSTYSNENDIVLDNCMGSNTTGLACQRLNRQFIGIEKEKSYYDISVKRLSETLL
jgi:site-specific DNA-methyltransferase (adenine-specific)